MTTERDMLVQIQPKSLWKSVNSSFAVGRPCWEAPTSERAAQSVWKKSGLMFLSVEISESEKKD